MAEHEKKRAADPASQKRFKLDIDPDGAFLPWVRKNAQEKVASNLSLPPTPQMLIASDKITFAASALASLQEIDEKVDRLKVAKPLSQAMAIWSSDALKFLAASESGISEAYQNISRDLDRVPKAANYYSTAQFLKAEIPSRKQELLTDFYRSVSAIQLARVETQRISLQQVVSQIDLNLKDIPRSAVLYKPLTEVRELAQALNEKLEREERRLTYASKNESPPLLTDRRGELLAHLSNPELKSLLNRFQERQEVIEKEFKKLHAAEQRESYFDNATTVVAGIAATIGFAFSGPGGVATGAAARITMGQLARVALFSGSVYSAGRYYKGLNQVEEGKKSFVDHLKTVGRGIPEDLTKGMLATTSLAAGIRSPVLFKMNGLGAAAMMAYVPDATTTMSDSLKESMSRPLPPEEWVSRFVFAGLRGATNGIIGARYGGLHGQMLSTSEKSVMFASEAALSTTTAKVLDDLQYGPEIAGSNRTLMTFLSNVPGIALNHIANYRKNPRTPPDELSVNHQRLFAARAEELGIPQSALKTIYEGPEIDPVTGFYTKADRIPELIRATRWASAFQFDPTIPRRVVPEELPAPTFRERLSNLHTTLENAVKSMETLGLKVRSTVYVEADIGNLTGLNRFYERVLRERYGFNEDWSKLVSKQLANTVFREITKTFRQEIQKISPQSTFFRHGGDEISAIVFNADPSELRAAYARINKIVSKRVKEWGLDDIPHVKEGRAPGIGIWIGDAGIESSNYDLATVLSRADKRVEAIKLESKIGNGKGAPRELSRDDILTRKVPFSADDVILAQIRLGDEFQMAKTIASLTEPFASPGAVRNAIRLDKLRKVIPGATDKQAELLRPAAKDPVTGLYGEAERLPALKRLIYDVGRSPAEAFWISARMENLAGLNGAKGNSGANPVLAEVAQRTEKIIAAQGGKVYGFRGGGANMNFVAVGVSKQTLDKAILQAQSDVRAFASEKHLTQIANKEHPAHPGLSLSVGVVQVKSLSDPYFVLAHADAAMNMSAPYYTKK